jgi:hypothetical protein
MKQNVGAADRAVRIVLGLGLLSAIFFVEGSVRWFGLVGLIPLATGLVGSCPLYSLFGLSTCLVAKPKT